MGGFHLMISTDGQPAPPSIEAQRLALDTKIQEARLDLDIKSQETRLATEINRDKRESAFFRANAAVIITSLIALMTVIISATQFYFTLRQQREKDDYTQKQDNINRDRDNAKYNAETAQRVDEQRLKVLEYLTANYKNIFSDNM